MAFAKLCCSETPPCTEDDVKFPQTHKFTWLVEIKNKSWSFYKTLAHLLFIKYLLSTNLEVWKLVHFTTYFDQLLIPFINMMN